MSTPPNPSPRGFGSECGFCGEQVRRMSHAAQFCCNDCRDRAAAFARRRRRKESAEERARREAAPSVALEPVTLEPLRPVRVHHLPATPVRRPWPKAAELRRAMLLGGRHD